MPPNRQNPNGEPINSLLVEEKLPIAKEAYCCDRDRSHDEEAGDHGEPFRRHGHRRSFGEASGVDREVLRRYGDRLLAVHRPRARVRGRARSRISQAVPGILGSLYEMFFRVRREAGRNQSAGAHERRASSSRRMRRSNSTTTDSSARRSSKSGTRRCRSTKTNARVERRAWAFATSAASPATSARWPTAPGLAMATMDAVSNAGGEIANFLDVGGGANAERVRNCYELVVNSTGAKVVLRQHLRRHHARRRSRERYRGGAGGDDIAQDSARDPFDRHERKRRPRASWPRPA